MEYEQMADSLAYGEEYNFYYKNEEYWLSKNQEGHYLTKVSDGETQEFKTSEDLLGTARINGKLIIEIWEDIQSQFYIGEIETFIIKYFIVVIAFLLEMLRKNIRDYIVDDS